MPDAPPLRHPWLLAVWPGMGNVALTAGYYLMAKLAMRQIAEFDAREAFDVEHVEVHGGLVRPARLPRSRLFAWRHPGAGPDGVVFVGEAQPAHGRLAFCERVIARARELGVERVFTFAAMATDMRPAARARVFGAATDAASLGELRRLELEILQDGHIGGLNGLLLGAAAAQELSGACLLGEMPHVFLQVPFPKASLAVLEAFTTMTGIELDLAELAQQAREVEQQLGELLAAVERKLRPRSTEAGEEPEAEAGPAPREPRLSPENAARIDELFAQAKQDRAKAYELKRTLDRLGVFAEYEDRFLDLFR